MAKFRRLDKAGKTGVDFGFVLPNEDTFRFCQRYRVSKSFEGIQLAGYSPATTTGYSGLFKILLTWSAFETYLKISGQSQSGCNALVASYDPEAAVEKIRAIDKGGKFYLFLAGQVNPKHQQELLKYFQEKPFNITYLASAVRHIFAHGSLTAHSNQTNPGTIKQIANVLRDFLLFVVDSEFTKHVDRA
jgi:hypothetical protein